MTKVSVRTGDTVLVNSGKDSGKKGKVLAVKRNKDNVRVIVEGANIVTKAKKARTAQAKRWHTIYSAKSCRIPTEASVLQRHAKRTLCTGKAA